MANEILAPYKTLRVVETVFNYARADQIDITPEDIRSIKQTFNAYEIYDDGMFWRKILESNDEYWDKSFQIFGPATLSEWVARVPGLYWKKGSETLRNVTESAIEQIGNFGRVLQPIGKSQVVLGGIGTLRLPPDANGYRMVSISIGRNPSMGIPVLFTPDVWDALSLKEGSVIDKMRAVWRKMPTEWHPHFKFVNDMPRGCFVVTDSNMVSTYKHNILPTLFHPFSVMEYYTDSGIFFDYVFVTATNEQTDYRSKVQEFFEYYRNIKGRNGTYMLECDIATPFLDAAYSTPAELRQNNYGESQLDIITKRIKGDTFKGRTIEKIIEIINNNYTSENIKKLGEPLGLKPFAWITNDPVAKLSIKLLDFCIENNRVDSLLELLVEDNPQILN